MFPIGANDQLHSVPEATLVVSNLKNKTIAFQKQNKTGINNMFLSFTKATSQSNWTVIRWISIILSRLSNRNYNGLFPTNLPLTQTSLNA